MKIQELIENLKSTLKDSIKDDMDVGTINKINQSIQDCDEILNEHSKVESELGECKNTIIKLVKTQGDANPPKETIPQEQQPRSLEEIARQTISK